MRLQQIFSVILLVAWCSSAAPAQSASAVGSERKLVLITHSKGYDHEVVRQKDGTPSVVERTFQQLADRAGLFDVEASRDASILTPEKLKATDIVVFYTTLDLPMKPDDLDAWVKNGGLFIGIHSATDTFHKNEIYEKLIGGEFVEHPWNADKEVTIKVLDLTHPAGKPWGAGDSFKEEIYRHDKFDPASVHVIIGLDMEKTAEKKPYFVPIAWCKEWGKGKMFYTSLGHNQSTWENPKFQDHLINAIRWMTGALEGDATPNPTVSAAEDAIARKVSPSEKPKKTEADKPAVDNPDAASPDPEQKAAVAAPGPKPPEGFSLTTFARAPDIKSPVSIACSPDGKLFVGEDEYNTQPKRDPGLSRVKLCVDTNNDGIADQFTVFADKLNSPQGMTFVGQTLYVAHAPLLTAFRDTNNDGVADVRDDLVTGFGPVPEGLVHHIPSGLRMGIDGWLYCSVGDKGIVEAKGKDGKKISLWGGGVVRVRPDGTMLEIFSLNTRNTFDVSVSPLLDVFTRDNTNDGDGWDSRLAQMQRDGEYGYPRLFKNYTDEIIEPVASYGGGSATGSMYLNEPGFPKSTGDSLYTCDWVRGILYRHDLKRKGAGFETEQEEFVKNIWLTDVEVDGMQHIFIADWGRRDWGNAAAVGNVYRLQPVPSEAIPPGGPAGSPIARGEPAGPPGGLTAAKDAAAPTTRTTTVDLASATDEQLLTLLAGPSQTWRLNAQQEILRRGQSPKMIAALTNLAMKKGDINARVAALFALKQLAGEESNGTMATLAALPELREFALRAMADREDEEYGVNPDLFIAALTDPNPRCRVQAAVGIGHLRRADLAPALIPLTGDNDPLVRHAAMQSLRRLNAETACIAAIKNPTLPPEVVAGALRTLRNFHTDATVNAVAELQRTAKTPFMRQEAVKALAKLYHVESKWDGTWWTPHPDTRGPWYVSEAWARSGDVANLLLAGTGDADLPTAKLAVNYIGQIEMKEAIPSLTRMIAGGGSLRDDAAGALIAMKPQTPEAITALEKVVLGDNFDPKVRIAAVGALADMPPAAVQSVLIRIASRLDDAPKLPPELLEKVCDSLSDKPAGDGQSQALMSLLSAGKAPVRIAAAMTLMRSADPQVRDQVNRIWQSSDPVRIDALLSAVSRVPVENATPYTGQIHALLSDEDDALRQGAVLALGHVGDASSVKDLMQLASRDRDPLPAVSALAGIDPAKTSDDQVLAIATLLVENSAKVQKGNQETYVKLVNAAQKFIADPRVPGATATSLRNKLMEPGVIYSYMRTEPIPVAPPDSAFKKAFPPEAAAGGPFLPFSVDGKEIVWTPMLVSDPRGLQPLEMPERSVAYFAATIDVPAPLTGYLTTGSDDALKAWVNGNVVLSEDVDRGMLPDMDELTVPLVAGKNTLLLKVINNGGPAGVQSRIRTRVAELEPHDLEDAIRPVKPDIARGRELFTNLGCNKCHTTDRHEELKGPFLGDVGGKFDARHIAESILRPNEKIAQGFATERIMTKTPDGDYTGFVTRESAEEVQLRDLTGKVTIIPKSTISKRTPQRGSMMPQGLADGLSLDDFSSLLGYLKSMK